MNMSTTFFFCFFFYGITLGVIEVFQELRNEFDDESYDDDDDDDWLSGLFDEIGDKLNIFNPYCYVIKRGKQFILWYHQSSKEFHLVQNILFECLSTV